MPLSGELGINWKSPLRVLRVDDHDDTAISWSTFFSTLLGAVVGAISALIVGWWSDRGTRRSLSQHVNAAELKDLQTKLDAFYGPYLQRSAANKLLIEEFRSLQPDPENFRTLTLLLTSDWRSLLSQSDQTIVGEIVENDIALCKLIHGSAGLVDSQVMMYLSRAAVHFRFMQLAFEGKLGDSSQRFDAYVYPRQLDAVLLLEVKRLTDRCGTLRREATDSLSPIPPLQIPKDLELRAWTFG